MTVDAARAGEVDVLVVGAGLSGIGAVWHLEHELPWASYAVLEGRDALGGTWDLFRFPGVRSDSDMYTLSYPWLPWTREEDIAGGEAILDYLHQAADRTGLAEHVQFRTKVASASWSSDAARWTVTALRRRDDGSEETQKWTCRFLYCCTGYYDTERGYVPEIDGLSDFQGQVVHPQAWPSDLDLSGRRVVVVGSGATAVTLVPVVARQAGHVTMLQRSPSYVGARPVRDPVSSFVRRRLPAQTAHRVNTVRGAAFNNGFYVLAKHQPKVARQLLRRGVESVVTDPLAVEEHWTPSYQPWDQRLCVVLDGDLLQAVADGSVTMVTGHIDTVTDHGLTLTDGRELDADVIVLATGLVLLPLGGVAVDIDGQPVDLGQTMVYRGCLVSGVPNLALCVGYVNASWTLRAELTHGYVVRMLAYLRDRRLSSVTPVAPAGGGHRPLLDLTSGYIQRGAALLPKQGDADPWQVPQNWFVDRWRMWRGRRPGRFTQDLTFTSEGSSDASAGAGVTASAPSAS